MIFMEYPPTKIEQTINMTLITLRLISKGDPVIKMPISTNTHAIGSNLSPCFLTKNLMDS